MSDRDKRIPPDPELLRQLEVAADTGGLVEAVLSLRRAAAKGPRPKAVPSGDEFQSMAEEVLSRAEREAGAAPARVNVYRALGSIAVTAPADFVRALLAQDEVVSATAARPAEDVLIRPVKRPRKK